jgi:catechol 2,3-dioxygenase-like lactoylglutathione lyase family enzyme
MASLRHIIPVLRIFDAAKAREFYVDYLGFDWDWEHRDENGPLYAGVKRGAVELHLSEHHGDATPGSQIRIAVDGVAALHAAVTAKDYRFARPELWDPPWGGREFTVWDPFGNRIAFFERD